MQGRSTLTLLTLCEGWCLLCAQLSLTLLAQGCHMRTPIYLSCCLRQEQDKFAWLAVEVLIGTLKLSQ